MAYARGECRDGYTYVEGLALMHSPDTSRTNAVFMFGPFHLFVAERLLKNGDDPVRIGGRALDILIALLERPGELATHNELMARVWPDVTVEVANLHVQIAALRKALGDGHDRVRYLSNVVGRGYCFVAPVVRLAPKRALPQVDSPIDGKRIRKRPARLARTVGREERVRTLLTQLMQRFVNSLVQEALERCNGSVLGRPRVD